MAVTVNATGTVVTGTVSPVTSSTSITVGAGATALLIIVQSDDATATLSAPTWNGVAATLIGKVNTTDNATVSAMYGIVNPASGTNALSVSWTGGGPSIVLEAIAFNGSVSSTVAACFTGFVSQVNNTAGTTSTVTVTSAVGDIAVAAGNANVSSYSAFSGTSIYANAGLTFAASAARQVGAATVAFTGTLAGSVTNNIIGVDVAAGGAAAVSPLPFLMFEAAKRRIIPAAMLAGGLIWAPQVIAPSPSNTVTIDKWQQPLSMPVPAAKVVQSGGLVPYNPPQAQSNTTTIDKWQQPLSRSVAVAGAQQGSSFLPFDTPQTNTSTIDKWLQPLSIAIPAAIARPGASSFPFNTLQTNTVTIDRWLQPLSRAVPPAQPQQGIAFVPFDTLQLNTATIDKWAQPLSVAVPAAKGQIGYSFVPFDTLQQSNTVALGGWQRPLSVSVPVAQAIQGSTFVPFDTQQAAPVGIAGMAWFNPLSLAPPPVSYLCQSPYMGWVPTILSTSPVVTVEVRSHPFFATVGQLMGM